MKKRLIRIGIVLTILIALVANKGGFSSLFKSTTAQAIGDLSVDWGVAEGNPIFTVVNMSPEDDESRTVTVHNDATTPRQVSIRGIKTSETGTLASAFSFVILEGATEIYGGSSPTGPKTLQQFFTESGAIDGIPLSNLAGNTSTSYTFLATFNSESGNEFQSKQLVFDLKIGIVIDIPVECSLITFSGNPIFGTQHKDILIGTAGNDLIFAFENDDIVKSGGGDDCIIGGSGNDALLSGVGNDVVFGNDGNDAIVAGSGNDLAIGGNGNDSIKGEDGNDTLSGDAGLDAITGGKGNDSITGGADKDALSGDNDNDQIQGNSGDDAINGGAGADTINGGIGIDAANGSTGIDTCDAEVKISCEI